MKNGTNILQTAFGQFVNYYQRFIKVISHEAFADNQQLKSEVVDSQQIIAELKKYKPVYWNVQIFIWTKLFRIVRLLAIQP